MTTDDFKWDAAPLSSEDEKLIEAYVQGGVALDGLAYTDTFRQVARRAGFDPNDETKLHDVYRRLLSLRKRGRLPRLYAGVIVDPA
ncbi:MAG: hypothetical protein NTW19_23430 [Planctomycetota bacterium]|nr:hypothetical protein [Planctomycetota bacterium]